MLDPVVITGQVETLKLDYEKQHVLGPILNSRQIGTLSRN